MKIKRTAKFHKKLTLKQVQHLKDMKISVRELSQFVENMWNERLKNDDISVMCWDCVEINNRLNKEVA
tara:strand:- start:30238 stop:30441 length:204 start_codon:yes stop_codon:yes gene_type:complete